VRSRRLLKCGTRRLKLDVRSPDLQRHAYFWAEGFTCDPRLITETLGLIPTAGGSPASWRIHSQVNDPAAPLDAHIANLLDLVEPRLRALREIVRPLETGINCVAYFEAYQGNGFHLSADLLRRLADQALSVDFDLYGSSRNS
jgi:Domain of unknown function (DUF4279)